VMKQHVREKPFDVFAIGLGAEIREAELRDIGKSGTAMAADRNAVVSAFDQVGAKVEARTRSFYLLSYCSPSRAGTHAVRVEAVYKDAQGGAEKTGDLETRFDATGFGPGCDPSSPPSFDVSRGDALAPKPEKEAKHEEKSDKKSDRDEKKDTTKDARPAPRAAAPAPAPKPAAQAASDAAAPAAAPAPAARPQQDFNP